MVYQMLRWLEHLCLPARCVACQGPAPALPLNPAAALPLDLCDRCRALMPIAGCACPSCGIALSGSTDRPCGRCLRHPPRCHRTVCALHYAYPARELIQQLKYGAALPVARVLAGLMATRLMPAYACDAWPDCIVPVPLHATRYRQRGFNQVIEMGRVLAQQVPVPLHTGLLVRRRATAEQAGLKRNERRRNLRGAFALLNASPPAHVALLDDVITTGSTVDEITRTLRRAGVERVDVWGLARTQPTQHRP